MVEVDAVVNEGLGNSSYLLDLGDGRAAVIDPERDPRPYLARAGARGLRVAFAVETHVHADFVTGSRELAAAGAQVVAARGAKLGFPHRGLDDGQRLDLGGLTLEAVATPGHTPGHVAWLVRDGDAPAGVFTGGALVVGGVARTDLAGPDRAEELSRAVYRSVTERLLTLPGELPVWPTHGPGSFCSTGPAGERISTIGKEKAGNPLLAGDPDEELFVARLMGGLSAYPAYFDRLPRYNRCGPRVYAGAWPALPELDVANVYRMLDDDEALLIDVRPVRQFAAGHIPAAVSIELRPQFATWLGWLADPGRPLVFVLDPDQDPAELVSQCLNVGYENLAGALAGGIPAWQAAAGPLAKIPLIGAGQLGLGLILDIRQQAEWDAGHIPHAIHIELGALPARASSVPAVPLTVMCAHGQRSMTAASLIARARGTTSGLGVFTGSAQQWSAATGCVLRQGP
jgi:glyoxylase-like metal-dependent hydrolase (beta-lactamase superfamily II)/rhodanese-related sulfurtransferase